MKKSTLQFLHLLKENNNRDWFNENKSLYEDAKLDFEHLVDTLIPLIQNIDPRIVNLTSKQTTFRIYRDIRFSKDKTPYKPYFGSYIAPGGRKSIYCGYYLHIGPGESMLAGGAYHPQGLQLKKLRSEIYYNLNEYESIINNHEFRKTFGQVEGDQLKRPPKDFPADFPDIDLLKFKSYTVMHAVDSKVVLNADFEDHVIRTFRELYPLNRFLNRALEG